METEVVEKAQRRRFSGDYKRKILKEAASCTQSGELGALLRREGLYSSNLAKWRRQAEQEGARGLDPKRRGPVAKPVDPSARLLAENAREIKKLTRRAERAEAIVELQKKVSQLLGIVLPTLDEETS